MFGKGTAAKPRSRRKRRPQSRASLSAAQLLWKHRPYAGNKAGRWTTELELGSRSIILLRIVERNRRIVDGVRGAPTSRLPSDEAGGRCRLIARSRPSAPEPRALTAPPSDLSAPHTRHLYRWDTCARHMCADRGNRRQSVCGTRIPHRSIYQTGRQLGSQSESRRGIRLLPPYHRPSLLRRLQRQMEAARREPARGR